MSTHVSVLPARAPRSAFGKLVQSEATYAWRAPLGLLLGVGVPVLVLVVLGLIPGANKPVKSLGGLTLFSVYFPVLIVLALAVLSLLSLPTHLASYREQGILRRLSTTPVPPGWMLAAQVIINLTLAALALGILVVAGMAGFGLGAPGQPGGFILALLLSVAAMFAIGLWIAAIARTQNAAAAIGQLLLIPCCSSPACTSPGRACRRCSGTSATGLLRARPRTRCRTRCLARSRQHSLCWSWPPGRWYSRSWRCASSGGSRTSRTPVRQNEEAERCRQPK